ncbi:AgmX/PglI C-terminal domain-containing protein [bacterium]|nr:AgmX/PglI C-terminal domain-containing protein [bacterium]
MDSEKKKFLIYGLVFLLVFSVTFGLLMVFKGGGNEDTAEKKVEQVAEKESPAQTEAVVEEVKREPEPEPAPEQAAAPKAEAPKKQPEEPRKAVAAPTESKPQKAVPAKEEKKEPAKPMNRNIFDRTSDNDRASLSDSLKRRAEARNSSTSANAASQTAAKQDSSASVMPKKDAPSAEKRKRELTPEQVREVIRNNQGTVKHCYNKSLKDNASLSGKVELMLTVGGNGRVRTVSILTDKFRHTAIGSCLVDRTKTWIFPTFDADSQDVTVPFVLAVSK